MGSGGEATGGTCKRITLDGLCRSDDVNTEGLLVRPARKPWFWDPLYATGCGIEGQLFPVPVRIN